jgi:hypothetical protein
MSGIYAVRLAQGILAPLIKGIYAVETTVTQYGAFISEEITKQAKANVDLAQWFEGFCENTYQLAADVPTFRTYYAGLRLTTARCFIQNCLDMREVATSEKTSKFTNQIGHAFVKLTIPKVYCLAEKGQQLKSLPFLKQYHIPIQLFPTNSHFCMQACPELFIKRLTIFIQQDVLSTHSEIPKS